MPFDPDVKSGQAHYFCPALFKKLDILLTRSFFPPFVVTFFIALFVFVMQTLWLYIDDIAGKGIGFFLLVELVGYMSVSMIPMALPVAVLISSVMVLGNLAEQYELSSIKSAGVSLWRVMRPLMLVTLGIGVFSYFCSNYFIPVSNLKFKSRLHDIKNQKPALSLEESLFNDDFKDYSIRIGDKAADNQTIKDVLLYDDSKTNTNMLTLIAADSGSMYGSKDGNFFVMQLYDGSQVSEPKPTTKQGKRNYPMMRSNFESWTKVFDLDEFDLDRTDEDLFKAHHSMLSNRQLLIAIDSIDAHVIERHERFNTQTNRHFHFLEKIARKKKADENRKAKEKKQAEQAEETGQAEKNRVPSSVPNKVKTPEKAPTKKATPPTKKQNNQASQANKNKKKKSTNTNKSKGRKAPWKQIIDQPLSSYETFADLFEKENRDDAIQKAKGVSRTIRDQAKSSTKSLSKTFESRVKHVFEFHSKFSLAVACFIFLFVGAPMGAIVRKGGFGWPLLISIIFFMLFVVIGIFSKNIAERAVIPAILAAWMACLVIFPMGLALTVWAMRDMGWSQVVDKLKFKLPFSFPKKEEV